MSRIAGAPRIVFRSSRGLLQSKPAPVKTTAITPGLHLIYSLDLQGLPRAGQPSRRPLAKLLSQQGACTDAAGVAISGALRARAKRDRNKSKCAKSRQSLFDYRSVAAIDAGHFTYIPLVWPLLDRAGMALIDSPTRAARLARTIASDIEVYLQANVALNAETKRLEIERQIAQGRAYFRSRVSLEIDGQGIYDQVVESLL